MVRVPPHLEIPALQDRETREGPLTLVYSEGELLEQISRAAAAVEEVQGDQGTYFAAFVPFSIILAAAFRFTAPVVLPPEAFGLTIRAASPGLRFDVADGIETVFVVGGILQRIEDILLFTEGQRNANAFVLCEDGASLTVVRGNRVYAAKRLVYGTGQTNGWRIEDNECDLTTGAHLDANIDLADASDCLIQRNDLGADGAAIVIRSGDTNDVSHNRCGGGAIDTSATSGENVVVGNRRTDTANNAFHVDDYAAGNI